MRDERRALDRGAHIVVGTPGRLRDHIQRGSLDMTGLRAVVLDEADEMLDLGFREDLEFMLDAAPADRRTLMFSATVPAAIAKLAKQYQRDAVRVSTTSGASQHADIAYQAIQVADRDAEHAIFNLLRYHDAQNAIVFANTRATVSHLMARLSNRNFSVVCLSGELEPKRADPCAAGDARRAGAGVRGNRCGRARHRPAEPGTGDPCRPAVEPGRAAAPVGPHGACGPQGDIGADHPAKGCPQGGAPAGVCQGHGGLDRSTGC